MYLLINGNRHTCSKRICKGKTIKYLSVSPAPEEITGTIQMYRNDGFLLSEDNADSYERKTYTGTLLVVSNDPVPVQPDPRTRPEYRISVLENKVTESEAINSMALDLLAEQEERLCMMELTM